MSRKTDTVTVEIERDNRMIKDVVLCGECKYKPVEKEYQYPEKDSLGFITGFWKCKRIESPIDFSPCPCVQGDDEFYHWIPDDDWYCKEGEPK